MVAAAVKAQAGVMGADLAWQQSKEGVQGSLQPIGRAVGLSLVLEHMPGTDEQSQAPSPAPT